MWRRAVLALFALSACDAPASQPEMSGDCALWPAEAWIERGAGELGLASSGALIAHLDGGTVTVRPLREGAPAVRWRLSGARAILAIEPIGRDRHVLIAYAACGRAPCLAARVISREGAALGGVMRSDFPATARTWKRASSGGRAYIAWSTDDGRRALETWRLEDGSLSYERIALGIQPPQRELPVEILALGASGSAWAVIWRRGPTEATDSEVFLTQGGRDVAIEALHEALAIDAIAVEGDRVSAIATFEFSRPHLLSLEAGRPEPLSAEPIATGASPRGFRVRAELDRDAEGLWLRRWSAAGDPIGDRVRIADGGVRGARIAGDGRRLLVAWREGDRVMGRRVVCRR